MSKHRSEFLLSTAPGSCPAHEPVTVPGGGEARGFGRPLADLLLRVRRGRSSGRELGREGDRRAHELLVASFRKRRPQDAVRSEEGDAVAGGDGRLWIVDRLDGTLEYRERGRGDSAVRVALAVGGRGW